MNKVSLLCRANGQVANEFLSDAGELIRLWTAESQNGASAGGLPMPSAILPDIRPSADVEDILYRQNILREFCADDMLLAELNGLFRRFDDCRDEWLKQKRNRRQAASNQPLSNYGELARLQCRNMAGLLKRALLLLREVRQRLGSPESDGLKRLAEAVGHITENGSFSELMSLCGRLEYRAPNQPTDLHVWLDSLGRIVRAELCDHSQIKIVERDPEPKGWLARLGESVTEFIDKSRTAKTESMNAATPCERVRQGSVGLYEQFTSQPYSSLTDLLTDLAGKLFDCFAGIADELTFYSSAFKYCHILVERGLPLTYPTFGENTIIESFCDPYRSLTPTEYVGTLSIVPFDFTVDAKSGALVYGDAGSGKTTFLRALAAAQLLAQSGLPIPAKRAELRVYRQLFAEFTEAEDTLSEEYGAGRFEQEARRICDIVDRLEPGGLVILDEPFQSTDPVEGARWLYNILCYITDVGGQWVTATSLLGLQRYFIDTKRKPEASATIANTSKANISAHIPDANVFGISADHTISRK